MMSVNSTTLRHTLFACLATGLAAQHVAAGVIQPSAIDVSQDPGGLWLNSITFAGHEYDAQAFGVAKHVRVLEGRNQVNADWVDGDTDTPVMRAGGTADDQEATDPASMQDEALLNALNHLDLSEITDGEGRDTSSFQLMFDKSVTHTQSGVGGQKPTNGRTPKLVLFERGMNDIFDVQLITGGTYVRPTLSSALSVNSQKFWKTGSTIDTREIGSAQDIGAAGILLSAFGINYGDEIFGVRVTSARGQGPDFSGIFLAADSDNFGEPLPVPAPGSLLLMLLGLGVMRSKNLRVWTLVRCHA